MSLRVAIISDTHLPRGSRRLPERCVEEISSSDLVIHAGDFSTEEAHAELAAIGPPLEGVYGNVDDAALRERLPQRLELELEGARIGVIHDAGPKQGRLLRLRREFPRADLVVFGHSHMPLLAADGSGFQILNPGSPTERRRAPSHTMAVVEIGPGEPLEPRLIDL